MQPDLSQSVLSAIRRHRMFHAGDCVGVAVSGGADSVALLHLLDGLREELGVRLTVLHFNHQLRAAESDADEKFVVELAAQLGFDFFADREDVAAAARERKWNLEDAARRLRYAFFSSVVESGRIACVAVAHTADDQAETVLARLVRGTGPAGLAAIYPVKGRPLKDCIVRPLLEIRRVVLREYLETRGQTWCEDASNQDRSRLRSRLRHETLPAIEQSVAPAIVTHLGRLAQTAREDEAFWSTLIAERLDTLLRPRQPDRAASGKPQLGIRCADLLEPLPWLTLGDASRAEFAQDARLAVARRLVRGIVERLRGDCRQLTAKHVEQVVHLAAASASGHRIELPGIVVERSFDWLWFGFAPSAARGKQIPARTTAADVTIRKPGASFSYAVELAPAGSESIVVISEINSRFRLKVVDGPVMERETKLLDRDLLRSPLVLRSWRPGDSFRPQGRKSVHKLKQLFRVGKISLSDRAGWPVLTSAGSLVWTRGMPVAAEFAAGQSTQTGVVIAEETI